MCLEYHLHFCWPVIDDSWCQTPENQSYAVISNFYHLTGIELEHFNSKLESLLNLLIFWSYLITHCNTVWKTYRNIKICWSGASNVNCWISVFIPEQELTLYSSICTASILNNLLYQHNQKCTCRLSNLNKSNLNLN